nr:MAG TPA: Toxin SymE, type I toxin-antitoxin system [Bacteriophage sp.]
MIKALGVTPEDRSIELNMVGDTLTIRKVKEEG